MPAPFRGLDDYLAQISFEPKISPDDGRPERRKAPPGAAGQKKANIAHGISEPPAYGEAAAIYRAARARGISITTIDTLIAAIALEYRASVFTLDQDFTRIARMRGLVLYRF